MPINFLDNLQFNKNQLLGARLQNEANVSNVSSPAVGQILYETSTNKFKYYGVPAAGGSPTWINVSDGGTWNTKADDGTVRSVAGGNTVVFAGGTGMSTTSSSPAAGNYIININNDLATSSERGGIKVGYTESGKNYPVELASERAYVNVPWTDTNVNTTYTLPTSVPFTNVAAITLTGSDSSLDVVNFTGVSNQTSITASTQGQIVIGLQNNITTVGDLTVGGGDITLSGTGRIQGVDTVSASTDAASKAYVDNAVAGGLNVKGGFNANTGVTAVAGTNLYTNTAVAIGDYYTVTTSGNFFGDAGIPLTPGDSVLAQTAAASGSATKGNFAVIQSDTDLATAATVGLGNTNIEGTGPKDGLSLGYATGTATLGIDINSLPSATAANSESIFIVYDGDNDDNRSLGFDDLRTAIAPLKYVATSSSSTTHTFTHNLNSRDVIVQIYSPSSYETVYATVDRNSVNQVTVTTSTSQTIRVLIFRL